MGLFLILPKPWDYLNIFLLCICQINYKIYERRSWARATDQWNRVQLNRRATLLRTAANGNISQIMQDPAMKKLQCSLHLNAWLKWNIIIGAWWNFWMTLGPWLPNSMRWEFGRSVAWTGLCQDVPSKHTLQKMIILFFFKLPFDNSVTSQFYTYLVS